MTPRRPRREQPRRATLAAAAASTLGFLPVFLIAAQGVLVREELDFDEAGLGLAVSVFFGIGALLSAAGGRLSERLGPRTGMLTGAAATSVLLILFATIVHSWQTLIVLMGVAGGINALTQTSADISVARGVPERVHGFAFGVKTSCLPLATLLAGVAIPAVGVRFGWRVSFLAALGLAALVVALVPRATSLPPPPAHARHVEGPTPNRGALLILALAGGLGIGAVTTLGSFYVESALRLDMTPSAAGWWLAAGSLGAVIARTSLGAWGDRSETAHLSLVAWLWVAGGAGVAMFGLPGPLPLFAIATLVAFMAGSGWTGLFLTAIVRANPAAPGHATGLVMTGEFSGSVIAPLVFGAVVSRGGYPAGWAGAATALVVGACLLPLAQRRLRATAEPEPVVEPAGVA